MRLKYLKLSLKNLIAIVGNKNGLATSVTLGERWKQIIGSYYSISNYGRVRNDTTGVYKTPKINKGIVQINLCNKGKSQTFCIARLVAYYFIREIQSNERIKHKDGDFRNNYYKNLEIVSK